MTKDAIQAKVQVLNIESRRLVDELDDDPSDERRADIRERLPEISRERTDLIQRYHALAMV